MAERQNTGTQTAWILGCGLGCAEAGDGWREVLSGEIAAMAADSHRSPWQDGLPAAIAASLEPYRDRLEISYNPATNAFELGRSRKRGLQPIEPPGQAGGATCIGRDTGRRF